ncbi:MAG: ClbS/DfsB family four-helix bundle protein [Anaerolineales bacterium]
MSALKRKERLVQTLVSAHKDFQSLLDEMEAEKLTEVGVVEGWSVKDILAHISFWEQRVTAWAAALSQGTQPEPPFWSSDWSEDRINQAIYEQNRERTLQDVLEQWQSVHESVLQAIQEMSEQELFERKVDWLGNASFAEALPGNSFEHLRHHEQDIRSWLAALKV